MIATRLRFSWSPRALAALLVLVLAYFAADPIEHTIYHPIAHLAGLHMIDGGTMMARAYGALMVFRLAWNALVVLAICAVLGRSFAAPPLTDPKAAWSIAIGVATGLAVMCAAIGGIIAVGCATVASSTQSLTSAIGSGAGWMIFDFVGATGEELFGRVAILLVIERFVGWKGAILVSGLMFSVVHFSNPGASGIWLVRLFLQGMVLAYAVYRTRSLWWSVGYHTGWNWASAPLFGAAGSGYLDRGHLFDFTPVGPGWITGGRVGPEGSIFAFVAVVAAFGCLIASARTSETRGYFLDPKANEFASG